MGWSRGRNDRDSASKGFIAYTACLPGAHPGVRPRLSKRAVPTSGCGSAIYPLLRPGSESLLLQARTFALPLALFVLGILGRRQIAARTPYSRESHENVPLSIASTVSILSSLAAGVDVQGREERWGFRT